MLRSLRWCAVCAAGRTRDGGAIFMTTDIFCFVNHDNYCGYGN
jgi:hypothetical protein